MYLDARELVINGGNFINNNKDILIGLIFFVLILKISWFFTFIHFILLLLKNKIKEVWKIIIIILLTFIYIASYFFMFIFSDVAKIKSSDDLSLIYITTYK
jgi:hypothetical protein